VVVQAQVNFVAHTSMEVGVRVFVEDLRTKARTQATRAYVTMVAVDSEGKPTPVSPLVLETDEDRRRHAAAEQRRAVRLSERRTIESKHG
jgi:acyl-CoA hydrolase